MTTLRVAGICPESVVDGPGLRFVVFLQGCGHHCPGCHNPETWDPSGGQEMSIGEIIIRFAQYSELSNGITISGGEPLDQAEPLLEFLTRFREYYPDKSVVIYTGYTWEEINQYPYRLSSEAQSCLCYAKYLVDGPFKQELKKELPFRGSSNQRVLDLEASLYWGQPCEVYKG